MHSAATSRDRGRAARAIEAHPLAGPQAAIPGARLILDIEDLQSRLMSRTIQRNPFWRAMQDDPEKAPDRLFHGLCVENYHLLFRESYFDAPVLSYAANTEVRLLLNEFYCEEIGHDRILLKALNAIGLTEEALFASRPLRGTLALCNALSYWARHDPLFFLTTLGPLEGGDAEVDSFVEACRRKGLPEAFVGPIANHARINREGDHGNLTRKIFSAIPAVSAADCERLMRQTHMFIAIYDDFYLNLFEHYGRGGPLVRSVWEG